MLYLFRAVSISYVNSSQSRSTTTLACAPSSRCLSPPASSSARSPTHQRTSCSSGRCETRTSRSSSSATCQWFSGCWSGLNKTLVHARLDMPPHTVKEASRWVVAAVHSAGRLLDSILDPFHHHAVQTSQRTDQARPLGAAARRSTRNPFHEETKNTNH